MNLQKLIDQKLLEKFDGVSINQIKKRFSLGIRHFNATNNLLNNKTDDKESLNIIVYKSVYDAARRIGEAFLLLNGYRAKIDKHHQTVIKASKLIMNNTAMNEIFSRLDKMRRNRNTIEYDTETLDISDATIRQSIKDVQILANKIEKAINEKDEQQKLI